MSGESSKGMNTGRIVTIAVFILLVSALGYFMYAYFAEKQKVADAELNIDNLNTEITDLEEDIDNFKIELDNKDLDIEEKERLLAEKEAELKEKTAKIDRLVAQNKISKQEAEQLRAKVEQLEYYLQKYQKEIDELKAQVETLGKEKEHLTSTIDTMKGQMHDLDMKNNALETTVAASAILKTSNFKYYTVKSSGKVVEGTEFRKGRMDDFRICFDIIENPAAKKGSKEVYLQISDPKGGVIKDSGSQSGYFTFQGSDRQYSAKKTITFDGTNTPVCIDFKQPEGLEYGKGTHKVVVYCDGYDIASSRFEVK